MSDKTNIADGVISGAVKSQIDRAINPISMDEGVRESIDERRRIINARAMNALVDGGLNAEAAKLVVTLIARRAIPAISIDY